LNDKLDKDLIKFWQWCGFEKEKLHKLDGNFIYQKELGEAWLGLPLCLDTIYKYAIPKLQNNGYTIELFAYEQDGFKVVIEHIIKETRKQIKVQNFSPTNALYNAITKVIDNH
jgi:hypothetical protein